MDSLFRKAEYSISYLGSSGLVEIVNSLQSTSFRWAISNIEDGIYQFTVTAKLPEQNFTEATIDVSIIVQPTSQITSVVSSSPTTTIITTTIETTIESNSSSANDPPIDKFLLILAMIFVSIIVISLIIKSKSRADFISSDHHCKICGHLREFGELFCGECGSKFDVTDPHN